MILMSYLVLIGIARTTHTTTYIIVVAAVEWRRDMLPQICTMLDIIAYLLASVRYYSVLAHASGKA